MSDPLSEPSRGRLPHLRRMAARIPGARSAWYLAVTLRDMWRDTSEFSQIELRREFDQTDPWLYTQDQFEITRHCGELAMLERIIGPGHFGRVLEIGCAEGIFTEHLIKRCDSLLGVDFNQVALNRARERLHLEHRAQFAVLDLRREPLPGTFDLICAVHTLEYIQSPIPLWKIRKKIVDAIKPKGYLLLGCVNFEGPIDNSWWSRFLLRGGKRITKFFASHPDLGIVDSAIYPLSQCNSIDTVFQRLR